MKVNDKGDPNFIFRECLKIARGNSICSVRADTTEDSLQHITNLFNQAAADFPGLKPNDVQVVQYCEQEIWCTDKKGQYTLGIEFKAPKTPPRKYDRVGWLQSTRSY